MVKRCLCFKIFRLSLRTLLLKPVLTRGIFFWCLNLVQTRLLPIHSSLNMSLVLKCDWSPFKYTFENSWDVSRVKDHKKVLILDRLVDLVLNDYFQHHAFFGKMKILLSFVVGDNDFEMQIIQTWYQNEAVLILFESITMAGKFESSNLNP